MTRVVYFTAATLDGFIADEHDSLDWRFEVPHGEDDGAWDAVIGRVGVLVMGATTYQWVLDRHFTEHPEQYHDFYGERPLWVFPHRDLPGVPGVDVTFARGDVGVGGGGDLVGQFDDAGHLDEIQVHLTPVVLGAGRPLLPRRITSSRLTYREGAVVGQRSNLPLDVARPGRAS